jgi:hypothetical protein
MSSLRESCSTLARVAEFRFEELVFQNDATVQRNPWILFYKTIHSTLARMDKTLATICQETALIKMKANSLTLYEMFQKASQDTNEFLNAATDFASHMSAVLGITYTPPQQQQVISLPDIEELKSICTNPQSIRKTQSILAITNTPENLPFTLSVEPDEKKSEEEMVLVKKEISPPLQYQNEIKKEISPPPKELLPPPIVLLPPPKELLPPPKEIPPPLQPQNEIKKEILPPSPQPQNETKKDMGTLQNESN